MKKIVIFICIFLSISINIQSAILHPEMDFTFLVNSDIHQTVDVSRRDTQWQIFFQDIVDPSLNTSAVLLAGDLTGDGSDPQFQAFAEKVIRPISSLMPDKPHGGLYLCQGNHDETSGSNSGILNYIKNEYGNYYSFDIQGLHFACCGKYPQKTIFGGALSWLISDLKKLAPGTPVVIFFHYNILGPYSDWWNVSCGSCICITAKNEKEYFFQAIKDYNIQGIFFGHLHSSYSAVWRNKFRIACVGGEHYAICQYKQATKTVDIKFKDQYGRIYDWDSPALFNDSFEEL